MKRVLLSLATFGLLGIGQVVAQETVAGAPHTLEGSAVFNEVTLSWKAPAEQKTIQWHDGNDYNGMQGVQSNPNAPITFYAAAKFSADDLKYQVGETVDAISYFEYREVAGVTVMIYEDGQVVREQAADVSGYVKNSVRTVNLTNPYVIPAGKEVMFVVKYTHGSNQDFVAITDKVPTAGKGNVYSYDGKKWKNDGNGDFLVTAILHNASVGAPDSYVVYRDSEVAGTATDAAIDLANEPEGVHTYKVASKYGEQEYASSPVVLEVKNVANYVAGIPALSAVDNGDLTGDLAWSAPLAYGKEMTWSNKELGLSIGGTASTNTKVWIKQEFSPYDAVNYVGHAITGVNAYITEAVISQVNAFVMKDGVIDKYTAISADSVSAIQVGWNNFKLAEPYVLEAGHTYAFGLYYMHTPKAHPVGVDNSAAVNVKGNSFSVSSPSSKGFDQTKPSFKTLASGNIAGNFMLTADVEVPEGAVTPAAVKEYVVKRDGAELGRVAATAYTDAVAAPGEYKYEVVAVDEAGKTSAPAEVSLAYALPAEYAAPTILSTSVEDNKVEIEWSAEAVDLAHCGSAAVMTGFTEDLAAQYGAKFTADELADVAGYRINTVKIAIGAEMGAFKVCAKSSKGTLNSVVDIAAEEIMPGYVYALTFPEDAIIPAGEDLYLYYDATIPANVQALILDNGPAQEGGAMVSLSNGASWLKLSTIASNLADHNVFISAIAAPVNSASGAEAVTIGGEFRANGMEAVTVDKNGLGVEANVKAAAPAKMKANAAKKKPVSYNVYRNGEVAQASAATVYKETIEEYGDFIYNVTAVYENGWESDPSRNIVVSNPAPQVPQAPINLDGEADADGTLTLTWEDNEHTPFAILSHESTTDESGDLAFGMTKTGGASAYVGIVMPSDSLTAGTQISHINFKLNSEDLTSLSVFVRIGNSVVYQQDVEEWKLGWNHVLLNSPYIIDNTRELSFGYYATYASGTHVHVTDGNAEPKSGFGNLISSTGLDGYWYALDTKFKIAGNLRINATVEKIGAKKVAANLFAPTFNIYYKGEKIAEGVTDLTYAVANAGYGEYAVSAVRDSQESALSNVFIYKAPSAIVDIIAAQGADARVYNVVGQYMGKASELSTLPQGIYIVEGQKVIVK